MKDEQVTKLLQQLPPSTQFAIVNCLPNIPYGADWGLCELAEVKENLASIKEDKNLFALPVKGGVVLQVAKGYLETIVNRVQKGFVTMEDLKVMVIKQKEALETFDNFLFRKEKKMTPYKGIIGIYCTNLTPNIRYEDGDYPAFRVTLQVALTVLNKYGYSIKLAGGRVASAQEVSNLLSVNPEIISKSLIMSPTRTGVFINIVK